MSQLMEVPLDRLDSGENIRSGGVGDLNEMVASVSAVGIVTPVTVYQPDGSSRWMLVAGHRRVEAARRAGFDTVPALQLDAALSADDRLAVALVENLLREDIDPIDEANSYMRLREHGWTISKIAGRVGHSRGACPPAVCSARVVCPAHRQGPSGEHRDPSCRYSCSTRPGRRHPQAVRTVTAPNRPCKRSGRSNGNRPRPPDASTAKPNSPTLG